MERENEGSESFEGRSELIGLYSNITNLWQQASVDNKRFLLVPGFLKMQETYHDIRGQCETLMKDIESSGYSSSKHDPLISQTIVGMHAALMQLEKYCAENDFEYKSRGLFFNTPEKLAQRIPRTREEQDGVSVSAGLLKSLQKRRLMN